MTLNELSCEEKEMILRINENKKTPIVRFELRNSKEKSLGSIALNHVLITDTEETMDNAKKTSEILNKLNELKLVNLEYNLFVTAKSDYDIYYNSKLFKFLCDTVDESKIKPGFLFDTAHIKRGVATLTSRGFTLIKAN